jgi:hypothetical protein
VIVLARIVGLTRAEIAEQTGRSEAAVRALLALALAGASTPVAAHLPIIRQGRESRGSLEACGEPRLRSAKCPQLAESDHWKPSGNAVYVFAVCPTGFTVEPDKIAIEVLVLAGGSSSLTAKGVLRGSDFGPAAVPGARFGDALAVGDWDGDAKPDLAVGSPGYTPPFSLLTAAGRVSVYRGASSGLTTSGGADYRSSDLGETLVAGDRLGVALAFGRMDDSGRASLAVGVPEKANAAGQVHVVAPWRQVMGLQCKTSIALDCAGDSSEERSGDSGVGGAMSPSLPASPPAAEGKRSPRLV